MCVRMCVCENTCLCILGSVYLCESLHVSEWESVCLCVYVCVVRKRILSHPRGYQILLKYHKA